MENIIRVCGNCEHMKILKITPFVRGLYVGDGRCRLKAKDKNDRNAGYRALGDSCERFQLKKDIEKRQLI